MPAPKLEELYFTSSDDMSSVEISSESPVKQGATMNDTDVSNGHTQNGGNGHLENDASEVSATDDSMVSTDNGTSPEAQSPPAKAGADTSIDSQEPMSFEVLNSSLDPEVNPAAQEEEVDEESFNESGNPEAEVGESIDSGPPTSFAVISPDTSLDTEQLASNAVDPPESNESQDSTLEKVGVMSATLGTSAAAASAAAVGLSGLSKSDEAGESLPEGGDSAPKTGDSVPEPGDAAPEGQPGLEEKPLTESTGGEPTEGDSKEPEPDTQQENTEQKTDSKEEPESKEEEKKEDEEDEEMCSDDDCDCEEEDDNILGKVVKAVVDKATEPQAPQATPGVPGTAAATAATAGTAAAATAGTAAAATGPSQVYHRENQDSESEEDRPKSAGKKKKQSQAAGCLCC